MKKRIRIGCMMGMLLLAFGACGRDLDIYLEEYEENTITPQGMESQNVLTDAMGTELPVDSEEESLCYVYICGAVVQPGVYALPEGSRIYEVIQEAGGLTADADETFVNQAEQITDGMMIQIYTSGETEVFAEESMEGVLAQGQKDDGRIDINTATVAELMTLPGIGSAKAEAIDAYRAEHGRFSCIEDLMKVPGIKEGIFQQMKEHIKVND